MPFMKSTLPLAEKKAFASHRGEVETTIPYAAPSPSPSLLPSSAATPPLSPSPKVSSSCSAKTTEKESTSYGLSTPHNGGGGRPVPGPLPPPPISPAPFLFSSLVQKTSEGHKMYRREAENTNGRTTPSTRIPIPTTSPGGGEKEAPSLALPVRHFGRHALLSSGMMESSVLRRTAEQQNARVPHGGCISSSLLPSPSVYPSERWLAPHVEWEDEDDGPGRGVGRHEEEGEEAEEEGMAGGRDGGGDGGGEKRRKGLGIERGGRGRGIRRRPLGGVSSTGERESPSSSESHTSSSRTTPVLRYCHPSPLKPYPSFTTHTPGPNALPMGSGLYFRASSSHSKASSRPRGPAPPPPFTFSPSTARVGGGGATTGGAIPTTITTTPGASSSSTSSSLKPENEGRVTLVSRGTGPFWKDEWNGRCSIGTPSDGVSRSLSSSRTSSSSCSSVQAAGRSAGLHVLGGRGGAVMGLISMEEGHRKKGDGGTDSPTRHSGSTSSLRHRSMGKRSTAKFSSAVEPSQRTSTPIITPPHGSILPSPFSKNTMTFRPVDLPTHTELHDVSQKTEEQKEKEKMEEEKGEEKAKETVIQETDEVGHRSRSHSRDRDAQHEKKTQQQQKKKKQKSKKKSHTSRTHLTDKEEEEAAAAPAAMPVALVEETTSTSAAAASSSSSLPPPPLHSSVSAAKKPEKGFPKGMTCTPLEQGGSSSATSSSSSSRSTSKPRKTSSTTTGTMNPTSSRATDLPNTEDEEEERKMGEPSRSQPSLSTSTTTTSSSSSALASSASVLTGLSSGISSFVSQSKASTTATTPLSFSPSASHEWARRVTKAVEREWDSTGSPLKPETTDPTTTDAADSETGEGIRSQRKSTTEATRTTTTPRRRSTHTLRMTFLEPPRPPPPSQNHTTQRSPLAERKKKNEEEEERNANSSGEGGKHSCHSGEVAPILYCMKTAGFTAASPLDLQPLVPPSLPPPMSRTAVAMETGFSSVQSSPLMVKTSLASGIFFFKGNEWNEKKHTKKEEDEPTSDTQKKAEDTEEAEKKGEEAHTTQEGSPSDPPAAPNLPEASDKQEKEEETPIMKKKNEETEAEAVTMHSTKEEDDQHNGAPLPSSTVPVEKKGKDGSTLATAASTISLPPPSGPLLTSRRSTHILPFIRGIAYAVSSAEPSQIPFLEPVLGIGVSGGGGNGGGAPPAVSSAGSSSRSPSARAPFRSLPSLSISETGTSYPLPSWGGGEKPSSNQESGAVVPNTRPLASGKRGMDGGYHSTPSSFGQHSPLPPAPPPPPSSLGYQTSGSGLTSARRDRGSSLGSSSVHSSRPIPPPPPPGTAGTLPGGGPSSRVSTGYTTSGNGTTAVVSATSGSTVWMISEGVGKPKGEGGGLRGNGPEEEDSGAGKNTYTAFLVSDTHLSHFEKELVRMRMERDRRRSSTYSIGECSSTHSVVPGTTSGVGGYGVTPTPPMGSSAAGVVGGVPSLFPSETTTMMTGAGGGGPSGTHAGTTNPETGAPKRVPIPIRVLRSITTALNGGVPLRPYAFRQFRAALAETQQHLRVVQGDILLDSSVTSGLLRQTMCIDVRCTELNIAMTQLFPRVMELHNYTLSLVHRSQKDPRISKDLLVERLLSHVHTHVLTRALECIEEMEHTMQEKKKHVIERSVESSIAAAARAAVAAVAAVHGPSKPATTTSSSVKLPWDEGPQPWNSVGSKNRLGAGTTGAGGKRRKGPKKGKLNEDPGELLLDSSGEHSSESGGGEGVAAIGERLSFSPTPPGLLQDGSDGSRSSSERLNSGSGSAPQSCPSSGGVARQKRTGGRSIPKWPVGSKEKSEGGTSGMTILTSAGAPSFSRVPPPPPPLSSSPSPPLLSVLKAKGVQTTALEETPDKRDAKKGIYPSPTKEGERTIEEGQPHPKPSPTRATATTTPPHTPGHHAARAIREVPAAAAAPVMAPPPPSLTATSTSASLSLEFQTNAGTPPLVQTSLPLLPSPPPLPPLLSSSSSTASSGRRMMAGGVAEERGTPSHPPPLLSLASLPCPSPPPLPEGGGGGEDEGALRSLQCSGISPRRHGPRRRPPSTAPAGPLGTPRGVASGNPSPVQHPQSSIATSPSHLRPMSSSTSLGTSSRAVPCSPIKRLGGGGGGTSNYLISGSSFQDGVFASGEFILFPDRHHHGGCSASTSSSHHPPLVPRRRRLGAEGGRGGTLTSTPFPTTNSVTTSSSLSSFVRVWAQGSSPIGNSIAHSNPTTSPTRRSPHAQGESPSPSSISPRSSPSSHKKPKITTTKKKKKYKKTDVEADALPLLQEEMDRSTKGSPAAMVITTSSGEEVEEGGMLLVDGALPFSPRSPPFRPPRTMVSPSAEFPHPASTSTPSFVSISTEERGGRKGAQEHAGEEMTVVAEEEEEGSFLAQVGPPDGMDQRKPEEKKGEEEGRKDRLGSHEKGMEPARRAEGWRSPPSTAPLLPRPLQPTVLQPLTSPNEEEKSDANAKQKKGKDATDHKEEAKNIRTSSSPAEEEKGEEDGKTREVDGLAIFLPSPYYSRLAYQEEEAPNDEEEEEKTVKDGPEAVHKEASGPTMHPMKHEMVKKVMVKWESDSPNAEAKGVLDHEGNDIDAEQKEAVPEKEEEGKKGEEAQGHRRGKWKNDKGDRKNELLVSCLSPGSMMEPERSPVNVSERPMTMATPSPMKGDLASFRLAFSPAAFFTSIDSAMEENEEEDAKREGPTENDDDDEPKRRRTEQPSHALERDLAAAPGGSHSLESPSSNLLSPASSPSSHSVTNKRTRGHRRNFRTRASATGASGSGSRRGSRSQKTARLLLPKDSTSHSKLGDTRFVSTPSPTSIPLGSSGTALTGSGLVLFAPPPPIFPPPGEGAAAASASGLEFSRARRRRSSVQAFTEEILLFDALSKVADGQTVEDEEEVEEELDAIGRKQAAEEAAAAAGGGGGARDRSLGESPAEGVEREGRKESSLIRLPVPDPPFPLVSPLRLSMVELTKGPTGEPLIDDDDDDDDDEGGGGGDDGGGSVGGSISNPKTKRKKKWGRNSRKGRNKSGDRRGTSTNMLSMLDIMAELRIGSHADHSKKKTDSERGSLSFRSSKSSLLNRSNDKESRKKKKKKKKSLGSEVEDDGGDGGEKEEAGVAELGSLHLHATDPPPAPDKGVSVPQSPLWELEERAIELLPPPSCCISGTTTQTKRKDEVVEKVEQVEKKHGEEEPLRSTLLLSDANNKKKTTTTTTGFRGGGGEGRSQMGGRSSSPTRSRRTNSSVTYSEKHTSDFFGGVEKNNTAKMEEDEEGGGVRVPQRLRDSPPILLPRTNSTTTRRIALGSKPKKEEEEDEGHDKAEVAKDTTEEEENEGEEDTSTDEEDEDEEEEEEETEDDEEASDEMENEEEEDEDAVLRENFGIFAKETLSDALRTRIAAINSELGLHLAHLQWLVSVQSTHELVDLDVYLEDITMRQLWKECVGERAVGCFAEEFESSALLHFPPWSRAAVMSIMNVQQCGVVSLFGVTRLLKIWGPPFMLETTFLDDVGSGMLGLSHTLEYYMETLADRPDARPGDFVVTLSNTPGVVHVVLLRAVEVDPTLIGTGTSLSGGGGAVFGMSMGGGGGLAADNMGLMMTMGGSGGNMYANFAPGTTFSGLSGTTMDGLSLLAAGGGGGSGGIILPGGNIPLSRTSRLQSLFQQASLNAGLGGGGGPNFPPNGLGGTLSGTYGAGSGGGVLPRSRLGSGTSGMSGGGNSSTSFLNYMSTDHRPRTGSLGTLRRLGRLGSGSGLGAGGSASGEGGPGSSVSSSMLGGGNTSGSGLRTSFSHSRSNSVMSGKGGVLRGDEEDDEARRKKKDEKEEDGTAPQPKSGVPGEGETSGSGAGVVGLLGRSAGGGAAGVGRGSGGSLSLGGGGGGMATWRRREGSESGAFSAAPPGTSSSLGGGGAGGNVLSRQNSLLRHNSASGSNFSLQSGAPSSSSIQTTTGVPPSFSTSQIPLRAPSSLSASISGTGNGVVGPILMGSTMTSANFPSSGPLPQGFSFRNEAGLGQFARRSLTMWNGTTGGMGSGPLSRSTLAPAGGTLMGGGTGVSSSVVLLGATL